MRRLLIAGNWKMHTTRAEAQALARTVKERTAGFDDIDVAVFPPFVYLDVVRQSLEGSRVALGAQDLYSEPSGAFTGEVSGPMLVDVGCRFVLVGHSERRHVLGESDSLVRRKVEAGLRSGLDVVLCVGERLEEREAAKTMAVVRSQLTSALEGVSLDQVRRVVLAYEPVWAIGTGRNATPEQAEEVHQHLRGLVRERYNESVASQMRILYGGSVKPDNARALLDQPNIDGALVGGASLKADDFVAVAAAGRTS
jgi:triosephosphate isomerase